MFKLPRLSRFLSSTLLICVLIAPGLVVGAQAQRTATPITVRLITATAPAAQPFAPTVTSIPSATSPGPTFLQAPETAGNINVRAAPNLDSEILGTISFGTLYPALRRYFQWYELRYDPSPSGRAWVYGELVDLTGDQTSIQVVDNFADINLVADADENVQAGEGGAEAGNDSRILVIATNDAADGRSDSARIASPLPTFTRPPDLPAVIPTGVGDQQTRQDTSAETERNSELPPLFPILMLAGFGLIGLLINMIRS